MSGANAENPMCRKFNAAHQAAQAKVEQPFGYIKTKWATFESLWREGEIQLNYAVYIAFAFYNYMKTHP
eukprot:gene5194-5722_t